MQLAKEFIEAQKLTPEQVTALAEVVNNNEAEIKKTYDGKANQDAEAILDGAAQKVTEITGLKRAQGQKIADFIAQAGTTFVETKLASERTALEKRQKEIDDLVKTGTPDAALKSKMDDLQKKFDTLQQKEAEYDRVTGGKFEELYNTAKGENLSLKRKMAFGTVKPIFPDTVNKYEAAAKWQEFVDTTEKAYEIEFDESGNPLAVSRENKHKVVKLADLISKNEEITALTKGRQNTGTGADPAKKDIQIKGVPFVVPENASPKDRQKAITDYLTTELHLTKTSDQWPVKFAEFNKLLLQGTANS